jgi:MerR family transcriptional regulator, copper efflux regulator
MRHASPSIPAGLQIGDAAARSGVSAKMIRYYESVGLIRPAARSAGNYRTYDGADIDALRFIARARELGFNMDQIAQLLRLWLEPSRSSAKVKPVALDHIADLDRRIAALRRMRVALKHLTDYCPGDEKPGCPILDGIAGGKAGRAHHHG